MNDLWWAVIGVVCVVAGILWSATADNMEQFADAVVLIVIGALCCYEAATGGRDVVNVWWW